MKTHASFLLLSIILTLCSIRTGNAQMLGDWQFNTLPVSGEIEGVPASKIGWGYILTNQSSTDWLFATSVSASNPFLHGTATGMPFAAPVLAPGASIMVPYDGTNGLVDLLWDADAPIGFVNQGDFTVEAFWYDNDPFDPVNPGNFIAGAGTHDAAYRATVTGMLSVPEPGALALLTSLGATGSLFAVSCLRRRRKSA